MGEHLVSVILPVFNSENYIRQSISSILKQTYRNFELIVVDDGSKDKSGEVISSFQDSRIRKYSQTNAGPSAARNTGLSKTNGKYIAFIDADDLYFPEKLEKQVIFIESSGADAVYCDVQLLDEESKTIGTLTSEGVYRNREDFLAMLLFRQILPAPAALLIKRRCFDMGLKYDTRYFQAEDYKLTLDLASNYSINYLPEILYSYRRHSHNLSNQHDIHKSNEVEILKRLGVKTIKRIVSKATLPKHHKTILLAKILYKIGELKKSYAIFDALKQKSAISLFYQGNIHYLQNNFQEALAFYKLSIFEDKTYAEVFNNLGCCYAKIGRSNDAERCFLKAQLINQKYHDPANNLNNLLTKINNYQITRMELRVTLMPYH